MTPVPPEADLEAQIREYHDSGGVVEWARFDFRPPEMTDVAAHRRAAEATVREAQRGFYAMTEVPEIPPDLTPRKIRVAEFFGPLWAPTREVLIIRGRSSPFLNSWFYANDPEDKHHALDHVAWAPRTDTGYAYAFSQTPHNLQCSNQRCSELFVAINRRLFPYDLQASNVTIYEWPTDWAAYFDAGHEWWGAFLWTISWPGWRIVGVTASTTD